MPKISYNKYLADKAGFTGYYTKLKNSNFMEFLKSMGYNSIF